PLPPLSTILGRALGVEFRRAIAMANDPGFLTGIVPSANLVATANEMSRFYQLLLQGGELDGVRIFDPRTIRRATSEQSYLEFDFTLLLPFRYGMGFMLGGQWFSPYGPDTQYAFGHIGFTNVLTWAEGILRVRPRSEEHTSELQSRSDLVCRLLLEKKKNRVRPRCRLHNFSANMPICSIFPYTCRTPSF